MQLDKFQKPRGRTMSVALAIATGVMAALGKMASAVTIDQGERPPSPRSRSMGYTAAAQKRASTKARNVRRHKLAMKRRGGK